MGYRIVGEFTSELNKNSVNDITAAPPTTTTTTTSPSTTTPKADQNSDRKIANIQDKDSLLVDNLRKLAEVRTGDEPVVVKKPKNDTRTSSSNIVTRFKPDNIIDLEKLKKIADVIARENQTHALPKETTLNYTLSRDGVPIMTKTLHKVDERNDKMMSTTEENQTSQARKFSCLYNISWTFCPRTVYEM